MTKEIEHPRADTVEITIPSIGVGTMRTTTSYIVLLAALEGSRAEQADVLLSALEHLGIKPEELVHLRKKPDVMFDKAMDDWEADLARIRERDEPVCDHQWIEEPGRGFTYLRYCRKCFATERNDD